MRRKPPVLFHIGWSACIHCGACIAVCPQHAGFVTHFDTIAVETACDIACMACEAICPVETITHSLVEIKEIGEIKEIREIGASRLGETRPPA